MLKDLFRKLDKLTIDNCLDYNEFRALYQRLNLKLTEDDYNRNILRVYSPSYPGGLDKRAFLNFWKGLIKLSGEPIVWR
jgi:Ca2+-binding EF-hand superfamily protein